jgi:DNA-directed RNA polymerase specialized sigma24 family protein
VVVPAFAMIRFVVVSIVLAPLRVFNAVRFFFELVRLPLFGVRLFFEAGGVLFQEASLFFEVFGPFTSVFSHLDLLRSGFIIAWHRLLILPSSTYAGLLADSDIGFCVRILDPVRIREWLPSGAQMTPVDAARTDPGEVRYGPDDIREAIGAMSADEFRRVEMIVRYFAPRSGMTTEDLRQEAFLRVLGSRTCRVGTTMVEFLAGTIKSIASEAPRARKEAREHGGLEVVFVPDYGAEGIPDPVDESPSPEDASLSQVVTARELEKAMAAIDGDFQLQFLAEGLFDGKRGKELEELLDTDAKGLAAAKKKLSRKLQAAFPEGMPL